MSMRIVDGLVPIEIERSDDGTSLRPVSVLTSCADAARVGQTGERVGGGGVSVLGGDPRSLSWSRRAPTLSVRNLSRSCFSSAVTAASPSAPPA